MTREPTLFLASSGKARDLVQEVARQVAETSQRRITVRPWYGEFPPSQTYLAALHQAAKECTHACFLLTPDDALADGRLLPRDNVLFELGFFTARHGTECALVVRQDGVHVLSDLSGHSVVPFSRHVDRRLEDVVRPVALEVVKAVMRQGSALSGPDPVPAEAIPGSDRISRGTVISVYRDVEARTNWFRSVEEGLLRADQRLGPSILYYGQGLEEYWLTLSSNGAAYKDIARSFINVVLPVLQDRKYELVVDLGIGDFRRAEDVLSVLLQRDSRRISYVAVDISYEMIAASLCRNPALPMVRRILDNQGSVIGINTAFVDLVKYAHLLRAQGPGLFMLLGNTLGNETDEVTVLSEIAAVMPDSAILLVELQGVENSRSAEDVAASLDGDSDWRNFLAGPFTALGVPLEETRIGVCRKESHSAVEYEISCVFARHRVLTHPRIRRGGVRVMSNRPVPVYLVKMYRPERVRDIFETAGLEVLNIEESPVGTRNFIYVWARRRG
jgi:hypothetical protein